MRREGKEKMREKRMVERGRWGTKEICCKEEREEEGKKRNVWSRIGLGNISIDSNRKGKKKGGGGGGGTSHDDPNAW